MKQRVQFKAYKGNALMLHTWAVMDTIAESIEREVYEKRLRQGDFTRVVIEKPGVERMELTASGEYRS